MIIVDLEIDVNDYDCVGDVLSFHGRVLVDLDEVGEYEVCFSGTSDIHTVGITFSNNAFGGERGMDAFSFRTLKRAVPNLCSILEEFITDKVIDIHEYTRDEYSEGDVCDEY